MEPPASSGPQPKQPRGLLSPREKASLRGAVRAYVHTRAPGPLPAPGAALRLEEVGVARLQRRRLQVGGGGGWRLERDAPTAGTPRMCRGFLGTRDCLLRDPSCQAQGGGVPSGFGGGLAAWLGGSGFGRLETGPGLWRAWGSFEAGAQSHTASGLGRQLALVKPSASGLQVGEKECGAEESMGGFGGKSVGSWAHPPLSLPLSFSLFLSLSLSLSHTHTHTH